MEYAMTTYLEEALLNHVFRGQSFSSPSSVWIALYTSNPTESGEAGTEVTGSGYSRQEITFDAPTKDGDLSVIENVNIEFNVATGNWGTVSHVTIMDAETGGNALMYGELSSPKTIEEGDLARFQSGDLTVKFG